MNIIGHCSIHITKSFNISDPTFDVVRVVVCLKVARARVTTVDHVISVLIPPCVLCYSLTFNTPGEYALRILGSPMQQGVYSGRAPPDSNLTPSRASGVAVISVSFIEKNSYF